tara:strand:- start:9 stop:428 length:420 start_codon:yes stop_codon:yes gene_type:complete
MVLVAASLEDRPKQHTQLFSGSIPEVEQLGLTLDGNAAAPIVTNRKNRALPVPPQVSHLGRVASHRDERRFPLVSTTHHNTGLDGPVALQSADYSSVVSLHERSGILEFHMFTSIQLAHTGHWSKDPSRKHPGQTSKSW